MRCWRSSCVEQHLELWMHTRDTTMFRVQNNALCLLMDRRRHVCSRTTANFTKQNSLLLFMFGLFPNHRSPVACLQQLYISGWIVTSIYYHLSSTTLSTLKFLTFCLTCIHTHTHLCNQRSSDVDFCPTHSSFSPLSLNLLKTTLRGFGPLVGEVVPTLADRGCRVVSATDSHDR
jgi:hypothetical protein